VGQAGAGRLASVSPRRKYPDWRRCTSKTGKEEGERNL
jgi:hypothetical protein